MAAPQLYGSVKPLLRDKHLKLRFNARTDYSFASTIGAVPIVSGEFVEISREYPIVFAEDAKGVLGAAALVGTRDGHNLYLDQEAQWDARYIPAFIRRYPFVFGEVSENKVIVCLDEASSAFSETEGDRLFEDNGEPSPALQLVLNLLHEYQRQSELTKAFVRRMNELQLLSAKNMTASLPDGRAAQLDGFLMVDQARLNAIGADVLNNLFTTGQLALIYAHLFSLGNFIELVRRQPLADRTIKPRSTPAGAPPLPAHRPTPSKKQLSLT